MFYRKKPVRIEANQFDGTNQEFLLNWMNNKAKLQNGKLIIHTLEGDMTVPQNWWVIKGIKGEFYPCSPEIFELTYDGD